MAAAGTIDLAHARARLAELDIERAALRNAIAELEREAGGPDVTTAAGRVELFASLFRGRTDVFATRWESTRTPGRSGWAPKCFDEWEVGLCAKPKVKCADCANRRFVPLSTAQLRLHLEGRQTAGIYPLLADETCWLVAIDLDGETWREDVHALRCVAAELDVPVLVERSRSGRGGHLWVLFSAPVPARSARALASMLLTRAMSRRTISMSSYDRLFPNQDTMPSGGFGNLIALPLQRARRPLGCTVFLDDELEPFQDQWEHLAQARRLAPERVELLASEAGLHGGPLGMRRSPYVSGSHVARPLIASRPSIGEVALCIVGRIEIPSAGLSPGLRDRLRRTAAFANPEFFERERARLSTHKTPRMIACHEETGSSLLLPRGCIDCIVEELAGAGVSVHLDDQRADGDAIAVTFNGTLTPAQQAAVSAMAEHEIGVLVAPPGAGKTVMGAALIAKHARSALVLVHRRPLLEQWINRLTHFLGLEPGTIGSSRPTPSPSGVDIAMIQSLIRRRDVDLSCYGLVLVDECHHVPAFSVERLMREIPARRVVGLTATPQRRDGHHPIITMQCGPVRHTITSIERIETASRRVLVERRTRFDPTRLPNEPGIQEVLSAVAGDHTRTAGIVDDVMSELVEGRYPLVLTERREHLAAIAAMLEQRTERMVVLHGGIGVRARRRAEEVLASDSPRIVLATGRYIGEGFDDPRLDTLVLAMPIAWKGTMTQYAGRLHRHHDAKHEIRVIDYVDDAVPVLRRMFAKRQRAYESLGYQPG